VCPQPGRRATPHASRAPRWVWRTPHGRHYLVDHVGTHRLDDDAASLITDAPSGVEVYLTELVDRS